jgi:hypothetical protein
MGDLNSIDSNEAQLSAVERTHMSDQSNRAAFVASEPIGLFPSTKNRCPRISVAVEKL